MSQPQHAAPETIRLETIRPETIRLVEHNLIDICDLLAATFSLDGTQVAFVHRQPGLRREWRGRLGDWLVADGPSWRVVSDAEFGRSRVEVDGRRDPGFAPTPAGAIQPSVRRPGALTS